MYEDDTPPAERRAQALSLDRELLRELLGQEELRTLLDGAALEEVERSLRPVPRDPDDLHDVLRLRGDLRPGEFDEAHAAILEAERRAIRVRVAGEERLAAAEDAGRYRDALGVMPPSGLPDVFLEPVTDALASLVGRWARGRGPFTTAESAAWFGQDVESVLRELEHAGQARPRRASPRRDRTGVVRRRGAPTPAQSLARRAPARGGARRAGGARPLPAELARDRPARVAARGADPLQAPGAAGGAVGGGGAAAPRARLPAGAARPALRVGRARLGRRRARSGRALLQGGCAGAGTPAGCAPPEGEKDDAIRRRSTVGALFWADCSRRLSSRPAMRSPPSGISSGRER